MELVRILPSSEDEVNVACFHPSPGGGLVYGTKVSDSIMCNSSRASILYISTKSLQYTFPGGEAEDLPVQHSCCVQPHCTQQLT